MEQKIVCAAMLYNNRIIIGLNYFDKLMMDSIKQEEEYNDVFPEVGLSFSARHHWKEQAVKGFLDNHGHFILPRQAYKIAKKAKQIVNNKFVKVDGKKILNPINIGLFSENVYSKDN